MKLPVVAGRSPAAAFALLVAALAAVLPGCRNALDAPAGELTPPRSFMVGGSWFPDAAGYWFHQYVARDGLAAFLGGAGFECEDDAGANPSYRVDPLRCKRGSSFLWGLLTREDAARLVFRSDGTLESAEAGCRYAILDSARLSWHCKRFVAAGAVYPDADTLGRVTRAMLLAARPEYAIDADRFPPVPPRRLRDASEAVERLARWRFACEPPNPPYRTDFPGVVGEIEELRCQQYGLRPLEGAPQSQRVLIRYDSRDLAVLGVEVQLDDASAMLPEAINSRGVDRRDIAQPRLQLETRTGERFAVRTQEVGTGSGQATRAGFETLTDDSQVDLLATYLERLEAQWSTAPTRLSHLNATSLEWYGPQAVPHLVALLSDERPLVSAAVLKHLCTAEADAGVRKGAPFRTAHYAQAMRACVDRHRADVPASIAAMDRLLAQDLRDLVASDARALNAFIDFRRYVVVVIALGPDAAEAAPALSAVVMGKEGLAPDLQALIADALAPATPEVARRGLPPQIALPPAVPRSAPAPTAPGRTAEQLLAELDATNRRPRTEIRRDLVRLGAPASPAMIAVLRDGASAHLELVVDVMCAWGPDAAGAVPELARILDAPGGSGAGNLWSKAYVVSALACVGRQSPEASRYLVALLKGPDPFLRAVVASRLQRLETTEVVLALGEALSDPDQAVREVAAGTLAQMGPKASAAIPMLARALDQKGNYVATAAANGLRAIGTPEALAELRARGIER